MPYLSMDAGLYLPVGAITLCENLLREHFMTPVRVKRVNKGSKSVTQQKALQQGASICEGI